VLSEEIASTINESDGQEIIFRCGLCPDSQVIDKPNPEYWNIKLAVARAVEPLIYANRRNAREDDDDEAIVDQPVDKFKFGGPFVLMTWFLFSIVAMIGSQLNQENLKQPESLPVAKI
jgi:hypothetical protein